MQIKAFEADVMEAQGYKAAITAADELRGLLEGSKRAGTAKAADLPTAFSAAPQVRRVA